MEKKTHMLHKAFIQELMHGNLGLHVPSRINCLFHREGTPFKQPAERYLHGWTKITNAAWHCHALPTLKNISPHPGICTYGIHMIPYYVVFPCLSNKKPSRRSNGFCKPCPRGRFIIGCRTLWSKELSGSEKTISIYKPFNKPRAAASNGSWSGVPRTTTPCDPRLFLRLRDDAKKKKQKCEKIASWDFQNKFHKQKYIKYHQIHVTWG